MVEVVAENLSSVRKSEQCKTLQTSICRVLTLPEVLTLYRQARGSSYWQELGLNVVLAWWFCFQSGKQSGCCHLKALCVALMIDDKVCMIRRWPKTCPKDSSCFNFFATHLLKVILLEYDNIMQGRECMQKRLRIQCLEDFKRIIEDTHWISSIIPQWMVTDGMQFQSYSSKTEIKS